MKRRQKPFEKRILEKKKNRRRLIVIVALASVRKRLIVLQNRMCKLNRYDLVEKIVVLNFMFKYCVVSLRCFNLINLLNISLIPVFSLPF